MLQEKALTVNLSINQWSARKHDKKISAEVESQHQAKDAGRYNKILIAKEELQKIQKAANAARTFHYENTLPWSDNGDRLLPSSNYFTYIQTMQNFKSDFEKSVIDFLANYDAVVDDARIRLNGMFNAADYPSKSELELKFGFKSEFFPLPNTEDFRINLSDTEINTLRLSMENTMNERIKTAMQDIKERIKAQLQHMKEKLSNRDEIFRDSLFENLKDIIALMPKLNVTNDTQINEICEEMKSLIADPNNVRNSNSLRNRKAQEVEAILNKFDDFFS